MKIPSQSQEKEVAQLSTGLASFAPPSLQLQASGGNLEKQADSRMQDVASKSGMPMPDSGGQEHAENKTEDSGLTDELFSAAHSEGFPMPEGLRQEMEGQFETDFSDVTFHVGEKSAAAVAGMNARACTRGRKVFFGAGEYQPETDAGKQLILHELAHCEQGLSENVTMAWALPTDWLDYLGLGITAAERIYIELAYEEGQEKDFQRFVNTLYLCIDIVGATLPGIGGGGVGARASHRLAIAGWNAMPASAQSRVISETARRMGWTVAKSTQMVQRYFSIANESGGGNDRRDVGDHESRTPDDGLGHTQERHVGKNDNWLRRRLQNNRSLDAASTFTSNASANRAQGRFVSNNRNRIAQWLRGSESRLVLDFDTGIAVGRVMRRGRAAQSTSRVRYVLQRNPNVSQGWHFVTSFPIP